MDTKQANCQHEYHWYLATNEDGWRCCHCDHRPGEPPGFSPRLDREMTYHKVFVVSMELHEANFVYFSNGSHGEGVASSVTRKCHETGLFDQYSIISFILESFGPSHARYWSELSRGILDGKDPRERCRCGKLATIIGRTARCSEHSRETF